VSRATVVAPRATSSICECYRRDGHGERADGEQQCPEPLELRHCPSLAYRRFPGRRRPQTVGGLTASWSHQCDSMVKPHGPCARGPAAGSNPRVPRHSLRNPECSSPLIRTLTLSRDFFLVAFRRVRTQLVNVTFKVRRGRGLPIPHRAEAPAGWSRAWRPQGRRSPSTSHGHAYGAPKG
jgi:hypothetical protein